MMALGVLAFVVALLVSVMLHEAGHFATAKLFKMKATQFFVGFGPTLWSRQKGETEYGVKAIPAGGFVKIIGMTPLEEVAPEDKDRTFMSKGGWQRFVVLVAGSTMHFIIALVLFFVLSVAWPTQSTGYATVGQVFACATPDSNGDCPAGAQPAPAVGALQKGDVITAVNGKDVATTKSVMHDPGQADDGQQVQGGPTGLIALVRNTSGPITLTIVRDGTSHDVTVTPVVSDGTPRIGFSPALDLKRFGVLAAGANSFNLFGQTVVGSFKAMGAVPHEVGQILSGKQKERSITSGDGATVTSVVGVAQLSGEAFQAAGLSGGLATLINVTAAVNLFVGIFNLFPFLPLDGGHVAILGYEKTRDWWRR
jgi:membrane-associated protease RseP (regulator of RpoE activity)